MNALDFAEFEFKSKPLHELFHNPSIILLMLETTKKHCIIIIIILLRTKVSLKRADFCRLKCRFTT